MAVSLCHFVFSSHIDYYLQYTQPERLLTFTQARTNMWMGEATGNEIMFQTVSQLWKELQGMDYDISNIRVNG